MNKKVLFLVFLIIVTSIVVVSQFIGGVRTEPVTDTPSAPDNIQVVEEVFEPVKNRETFSSAEYGFSFEYPREYKVEERVPGFFVFSLVDENVPQGGISIDARTKGVYQSFENAVKDINENYTITSTEEINGWSVFDVVGKDGMVAGMSFKIALHPYKKGVIVVETISDSPYGDVFDDFVRSFNL